MVMTPTEAAAYWRSLLLMVLVSTRPEVLQPSSPRRAWDRLPGPQVWEDSSRALARGPCLVLRLGFLGL